ncbi:hypothetical protein LCM4579_23320 [Ensifer sp. LCM 4579]|nr:hypothetical protein LCM4579_23320 [Ensifer sp. LCM 4579]
MPRAMPAADAAAIGQLVRLRSAREARLARRLNELEERLERIEREKTSAERLLHDISRREDEASPIRKMSPGKLVTGRALLLASQKLELIGRERSLAQARVEELDAERGGLSRMLKECRTELALARRKAARMDALASLDS